MDPALAAFLSILGTLLVIGVPVALVSRGDTTRLALAWKALSDPTFAEKTKLLLAPPPPTPPKSTKPSGVPLRMLGLLQREGRLLDFLLEDIQAYDDVQVGAAVRDIHRKCQTALKEHLALEPVMKQSEGTPVDVPVGFDPSAIRVVGNVTGQPPYRGTLQHHGWRVLNYKVAPPPEGHDELILHPAEVELP